MLKIKPTKHVSGDPEPTKKKGVHYGHWRSSCQSHRFTSRKTALDLTPLGPARRGGHVGGHLNSQLRPLGVQATWVTTAITATLGTNLSYPTQNHGCNLLTTLTEDPSGRYPGAKDVIVAFLWVSKGDEQTKLGWKCAIYCHSNWDQICFGTRSSRSCVSDLAESS